MTQVEVELGFERILEFIYYALCSDPACAVYTANFSLESIRKNMRRPTRKKWYTQENVLKIVGPAQHPAEYCPLIVMGGQAEGQARADLGVL